MRLLIERKPIKVYPDPKRVIARFFFNGEERAMEVVKQVMGLSSKEVFSLISPLLQEYSKRHRNITKILTRHCKKIKGSIEKAGYEFDSLDKYEKLLLGSYFTHEYSIESAAFFNPSVVEDPDQSDLVEGEKRLIISFRAVGEGHISSVVFRRALIDRDHNITVMPAGNYIDEAEIIKNAIYNKKLFLKKAADSMIDIEILDEMGNKLNDKFDYATLRKVIIDGKSMQEDNLKKLEYDKILWLSDTYHEISFSRDTDLSDRVIFPISEFERKGIEDARFVRFVKDDGTVIFYATYTAFDGAMIMPKLLQTTDFYDFKISPLHGVGAQNKNLALFPRKINGQYAMMSRIDGWNNYLMYSDKLTVWDNPMKLQSPAFPWEFIQIGNCGSPIETEAGWLLITHGVGPMRRYVLGASLFDLNDPSVEIGRLNEPLVIPNTDEREGYVPNVLYSCGSIIHDGELIIPYGLSDYCSSFATVKLDLLLDKLRNSSSAVDREVAVEVEEQVSAN
ncbi:MAG: glycoside hydrolase family 130 protein [Candidatus Pedobacter colombiensis]|uniref:Glycoside hydrolase family 130 protein n=1 Tax=Candidatus Pedobacter colombiensis TaxID=3121371 RepID=A0AAJ6B9W5_9SPHI|nr:glycoside hydrolase family 130 protein [Pedobacter sp.]WEK20643.1 MAG: glycoside hydrolase family 130 protein [Pedobacter sp.]